MTTKKSKAPKRLVSSAEAKESKTQHRTPCSDCPWARTALPGWLGGLTAQEWVGIAHGEIKDIVPCHTVGNQQCAGLAIYRANVCKVPRDRLALRLPANRKTVFSNPPEFTAHHAKRIGKDEEE